MSLNLGDRTRTGFYQHGMAVDCSTMDRAEHEPLLEFCIIVKEQFVTDSSLADSWYNTREGSTIKKI